MGSDFHSATQGLRAGLHRKFRVHPIWIALSLFHNPFKQIIRQSSIFRKNKKKLEAAF